jgi:hypothetical protein
MDDTQREIKSSSIEIRIGINPKRHYHYNSQYSLLSDFQPTEKKDRKINPHEKQQNNYLTLGNGLLAPDAPNTVNDNAKIITCAPPSRAPPRM